MALPAQPRRQRRRGGGESDSFPLPPSVTPLPIATPPLPAHLCLSLKLHFYLKAALPHPPRTVPSRDLRLAASLDSSPPPFMSPSPIGDRQVSLIFLSASPSPVVRLHADTPTQMISRHFLPREVHSLPVSPQVETICPQPFARVLLRYSLLAVCGICVSSPNLLSIFFLYLSSCSNEAH